MGMGRQLLRKAACQFKQSTETYLEKAIIYSRSITRFGLFMLKSMDDVHILISYYTYVAPFYCILIHGYIYVAFTFIQNQHLNR